MKELIERLLTEIPDYKEFLTVDELNESSFELAKKYPEIVSTFDFGVSREGEKIIGLKIGSGSKNALVFGLPHPNEPIGTMTMEFLTEKLATDKELRDELDYTWYVVKAWDTDGTRLNEGWFKGPYTIYNYARNFFRPAGHQQVEWTFPIDYKKLSFHKTIPETKAMMDLIDEIKPTFIYSLHNCGFGGVYWYVSRDVPEIYDSLKAAAKRQGIPLNLGEPEAPFCEAFAPAVYKDLGTRDEYDYYERYGVENPEASIVTGTCSADYAKTNHGSFTLLTELPYFYDERIIDLSPAEITRGQAIRDKLEANREYEKMVVASLNSSKPYVSESNPFRIALEAFTGNDDYYDAALKMTTEDAIYEKKATRAEEFDNKWVSMFYRCLSLGLLIRMNETELDGAIDEGRAVLSAEMQRAESELKRLCAILEENMNYSVVSIKKLVSIQIECGLITAKHLNS